MHLHVCKVLRQQQPYMANEDQMQALIISIVIVKIHTVWQLVHIYQEYLVLLVTQCYFKNYWVKTYHFSWQLPNSLGMMRILDISMNSIFQDENWNMRVRRQHVGKAPNSCENNFDGKTVFSSRSRTTWKKVETALGLQGTIKIDCKWNHLEITVTGTFVTAIKEAEMSESWLRSSVIRAWSQYTKVVGSISGLGTYRSQPTNA